ncbi:MAG: hypothetical protein CVU84_15695 [Firmicutes bacterium HGW-Firmicutes-1]|jgi:EAL domain-containing protein (putative c-di-GMP-specific phosphodiesterase class I)|nr:MAG: hypothetical protein CVU84_15695 [Firmicutes bacterium HGW-Firmicutes-1]
MNTYIHLFSNINLLEDYIQKLNIDYETDLLVQIYANRDDFSDLKNIHRTITSALPNSLIIGAITNRNIATSDLSTSRTMITFTTFSKSSFRIFAYNLDCADAHSLGKSFVQNELTCLSKVVVMVSNINPFDCEKLLSSIKSGAPKLVITGGIIPDYESERLFAHDRFYDNGIVGFVVDSTYLQVNTYNNTNFMPIGRSHVITSAKDNIIKSIDHTPAKTFYEKYLGNIMSDSDKISDIGYIFPLLLHDGTKFRPKPMLSITKQGYIITNTSVKSGDQVTLGYGNIQNSISNNHETLSEIKKVPVENLIVFNGLIRLNTTEKYIQYYANDLSIATHGIFTHAEIITEGDSCYISTGSFNVTTLSEDKDCYLDEEITYYRTECNYDDEQITLLNLVENTSKELNVINQTLENMVTQKTNELLDHYYIDELTKLPNNNKLNELLSRNETKSLAFIDISSFVNINNFYGNYIGNKLLSELSKLIAVFCFKHDYITYRIHADIFAVTNDHHDNDTFNKAMLVLQQQIHKHCFMELSLEIYIATVIAVSHHKTHIYENTSMTLEYAKGQKLTFLIYDQSLNIEESIKNNLTWTSKIRTAIEKDKIVPYYQPIYNNDTKETDHFEVLMRLIDEDGTVVTPINFLGIAKKANLYKSLTKIIIEKAFQNFIDSELRFSINLSSEDILDKNMRQFIYEKLEAFPKSHHVIFEIVESEGIENYDDVKEFINVTKSYGVQIAIDDFGTGFSNFHYLFKLNVDLIKIDGSIIQQINGEKAASLVAETIVDFSRKMGIATVAEFVSDEAIFNKTNELGINYSQGYYVSRPKASTDGM